VKIFRIDEVNRSQNDYPKTITRTVPTKWWR